MFFLEICSPGRKEAPLTPNAWLSRITSIAGVNLHQHCFQLVLKCAFADQKGWMIEGMDCCFDTATRFSGLVFFFPLPLF